MSSPLVRPRPRIRLAILVAVAVVWAGTAAGCSTVHNRPDVDETWETPAGFERHPDAEEEDEVLYAVQDGDGVGATVRRTTPAFPAPLLPHVIAHRTDADLDPAEDVYPGDDPPGWFTTFVQENWHGVWAVPTDEYIYWITATAPDYPDDPELLETLAAGFSPALPVRIDDSLPTPELEAGLEPGEQTELTPPAADGQPRTGLVRDVAFPELLTGGYLLAEPLTRPVEVDEYAEQFLKRAEATDPTPLDLEDCAGSCAAFEWQTSEDSSSIHRTAFVVTGDRAFQIRLDSPTTAAGVLEDHHRGWLEDFLGAPEAMIPNAPHEP